MAIIEVQGLGKNYGSVKALTNVSFHVEKGEIIGLLGPNGAGKTTTMKILAGYLQPTEGTVRVAGFDVVEAPLEVRRRLGYLPENAPLYPDMTVQETLLMMADLRGVTSGERKKLLSDAIYSTGLQNHLTKPIGSLSKGYRQRVGLAQAILHKPEVLILDEPTNGLDPNQIIEIRELIRRFAKDSTVIVSTHILSEVEATCHRAIIIMEGQVRSDARLDALTSSSGAVVAVASSIQGVEEALKTIRGVHSVAADPNANGYRRYRVTGDRGLELCPQIYDLARSKDWMISELRADTRTLESVFRELAQHGGVNQ
ncbi:MAG: ATP-binding cassette domain-containing protein [Myxococcales bacterium]|nr:ATP-binding cassette domain-containing protein [Myxococcales bacterium]